MSRQEESRKRLARGWAQARERLAPDDLRDVPALLRAALHTTATGVRIERGAACGRGRRGPAVDVHHDVRDTRRMSARVNERSWDRAAPGDVVALVLMLGLLGPFAWRTAAVLAGGDQAVPVLVALGLGVLAADFVTGCVHWFADTFFAVDTPLIGAAVIAPFREHHRDPLALTRRSFLRAGHANVVATSGLLAAVWAWRGGATPWPAAGVGDAWIVSLATALWLTNQFHRWAHLASVPRPVAWLQGAGLILTPARHARHHAASHAGAYCVTTGWLNPLLDRLQAFGAAERLIRAVAARRRC